MTIQLSQKQDQECTTIAVKLGEPDTMKKIVELLARCLVPIVYPGIDCWLVD